MSRRSATLITAPASEPVTAAEAKAFCKVDGSEDDALIASLIKTARIACEEYTKRAFITQTWKLVLDRFPIEEDEDEVKSMLGLAGPRSIQLPRQPIISVTSIKTMDTANTQTTVASGTYTLDQSSGRVLLNDGYAWPTTLRADAAVEITTSNGYGDASAVPEAIKQAILLCVYSMYASRQCGGIPDGAKELLGSFRSAEAFGAW